MSAAKSRGGIRVSPTGRLLTYVGVALLVVVGAWYLGYRQATAREKRRSQNETAALAALNHAEESAGFPAAGGAANEEHEPEHLANRRGSIVVKTEPPNALVKVGDAPAQRTPAVIPDLKLGTQFVQISMDGYETAVLHSEVQQDQPAELEVVLARSVGALRIESAPANLRVELKNEADPLNPKLSVTPLVVPKIETGDYEITVIREGWPIQSKPVTIAAGLEQKLFFEFPSGGATIKSEPPGARVVVDGKSIGLTPYPLSDKPPGEYAYALVLPGYEKYNGKVAIHPDAENLVCVVALARKPVQKALTRHASGGGKSSEGGAGLSKGMRWLRYLIPEGFVR